MKTVSYDLKSQCLDSVFWFVKKNKFRWKTDKPPNVSAQSWIVMNPTTNAILKSKFPNIQQEIASLTKIMTCIVAIEFMQSKNFDFHTKYCLVSNYASRLIGTSAELLEDDELSVYDLLHALMLPSGNDAAWVLAENLGLDMYTHSEEYKQKSMSKSYRIEKDSCIQFPEIYFLQEMNQKAKSLGMFDTNFNNPHGLADEKNVSTASDVIKMAHHAMKSELAREIVRKEFYFGTIWRGEKGYIEKKWDNTNKLLSKGFTGLKTGVTNPAGPCMTTFWSDPENDKKRVLVCVLKSKNKELRFLDCVKLTQWAKQFWNKLNDFTEPAPSLQ